MTDLSVAFFWHQHQPYYPDDRTGANAMPWVRLHGTKDYYGMAVHLLEVPEMRCTINLVPSLVAQIQAYAERGAVDQPWLATEWPAAHLAEADAAYLLDTFFMANPERMIRPWPRYYELLQRRAFGRRSAAEAATRFAEQDFRDLQTLFNLAWIHPLAFERDAELRALRDKQRFYAEEDKAHVLAKHRELLRQILPLHRRLADAGQVELTTTPYYHPILPLLFDKKLARQAMPDVKLPRHTGGYPEDAAVHVRRAIEAHQRAFGAPPRGMWPAEGSVCQEMIPLLARHGIEWIATDEGILDRSTQGFVRRDASGHLVNPGHLYRPYVVREGDAALSIVFRDRALSDAIGFQYQHSPGPDAADDFLRHLQRIRASLDPREPALVSVILDGENCWEHYPDGGVPFLRALYERCTRTPGLRPVTLGDHLRAAPPRDHLPRLAAGSWINRNFAIWVGHEEDNAGWDLLHQAREHLRRRESAGGVAPEAAKAAWEEIYIAEGSDWFWWYGDDHSSAQDALFDSLFRGHLANVYRLLGDEPPAELARPISASARRSAGVEPTSLLRVRVDGMASFVEWFSAGRHPCRNDRGTMATSSVGPMRDIYYGFDLKELFVRVDFDGPARPALAEYDELRIGFADPPGAELIVRRPGQPNPSLEWRRDGRVTLVAGPGPRVAVERVVELAVPFAILGVPEEGPVRFHVELRADGQSRDRAPRDGEIGLDRPTPAFESRHWNA